MERLDKLLSQNIKTAIKEIGELFCMFYLYYHFSDTGGRYTETLMKKDMISEMM